MRNGQRVQLKRGNFATKYYMAQITRSRRAGQRCVYQIRFADGDRETNVQAVRLRPVTFRTYRVCQRVQGNYRGRGRWYSARVTKSLGSGRYMVQYDDGDKESLDANKLRPVSGSDSYRLVRFRLGQRIMGNYRGNGRWFAGQITRVNSQCSYNIRYNDGDTDTDMHPIFIRAAGGTTRCTIRTGSAVTGNWRGLGRWYPGRVTGCSSSTGYTIAYNDGSRESGVQAARVRKTRTVRCTRTTFRVGQRVQGNWRGRGRWYHGIVRAASNCKYSIQYCDNDRETNVAQTNVRAPQGSRPSNCRV